MMSRTVLLLLVVPAAALAPTGVVRTPAAHVGRSRHPGPFAVMAQAGGNYEVNSGAWPERPKPVTVTVPRHADSEGLEEVLWAGSDFRH